MLVGKFSGMVLLSVVVGLMAVGSIAGPTAGAPIQEDEWPSNCNDVESIQNSTGTYTGVLDVPSDSDSFKIELNRGDYVTVSVLVPEAHVETGIYVNSDEELTAKNVSISEDMSVSNEGDATIYDDTNGENSTWEVWANSDAEICFQVYEDEDAADYPYEWQVRLQENSPDVNTLNRQVLSGEELRQREQRIQQFEHRIAELERRVSRLENKTNTTTVEGYS